VRARLLIVVAGLGREPQRCGELGSGRGGLAGCLQGLGQDAERHDLAIPVADLPVQRESLPEVGGGLPVVALPQADLAQVAQLGGDRGRMYSR
jgi:hypothetical protein